MTAPGHLRHSKAHREAVKRLEARTWYRWELRIDLRAFGDGFQMAGPKYWLPTGSVVREVQNSQFGREALLVADIQGGTKIILASCVAARCIGRTGPPKPGEVVELAHKWANVFTGLKSRKLIPIRFGDFHA